MYTTEALRRRRQKQSYELGRACVYSLIVKNAFIHDEKLSENALVKDNFFFGNNPGETSNNESVPYFIKVKLRSMFEDPLIADTILAILNYTSLEIGFRNLSDEMMSKTIAENVIPVDQLIASCYPKETVKKGRKVEEKIRRPNPIRVSPLFLKEEMKLVTSLTSLIFSDLVTFSKGYLDLVYSEGFMAVKAMIRTIINIRWETLQRFAHVTKERLQDIRKISGDAKIRKAGVTKDHVIALLKTVSDPAQMLVNEILHITGAMDLKSTYAFATGKALHNVRDVKHNLYFDAFRIYSDLKDISFPPEEFKVEAPPSGNLIDFEKSIKLITEIPNKEHNIRMNLSDITSVKSHKLFGRTSQLKALRQTYRAAYTRLSELDDASVDIALKVMYQKKNYTKEEFLQESISHVVSILDRGIRDIFARMHIETSENVLLTFQNLLEIAQDIRSDFGYAVLNEESIL